LFSFCFVHTTVSNDKTPLTDFIFDNFSFPPCIFTSYYLVIQETEDDTARTCKRCSAGKFLADGGDDQSQHDSERDCVPCKTKTYSLDGARFCSQCEVGKYEVNENGTIIGCALCEPGSFSNTPGSVECAACPVGKYQNEVGLPFCLPCLPGRYQNKAGSDRCHSCPTGYLQSNSAKQSCSKVASGFLANKVPTGEGSSSSYLVPIGSKVLCHGNDTCDQFQACAAGKYGTTPLANRLCHDCPAGFTSFEGATSCLP